MRLSNPHHRYSAKKQSSFDGSYCVSAQKNAPNIITRAHGRYAGQLKTFPRHLLSDAMCLVENLHQRLKTRWFSSGTSPILRGLIPRSVKTVHRPLSPRSTVLAGNEELFSITPAQVCDCSSPLCVSVMKVVCVLRTMMERST